MDGRLLEASDRQNRFAEDNAFQTRQGQGAMRLSILYVIADNSRKQNVLFCTREPVFDVNPKVWTVSF